MRATVAETALQTFEPTAGRPVLFAKKQLIAFAQERVRLGPLVKRPDEHIRLAGLYLSDDTFDDGGLARAACRDERPHAIRRRWVGDPVRQLRHQRVTAVKVRRWLERVNDANLAALGCLRGSRAVRGAE